MSYTLDNFRSRYLTIHELWGYRYETEPNYETLTEGDLRTFQHLTDFVMRFLAQGFTTLVDVQTMFGVDFFYKEGAEYNLTDQALTLYLKTCGPFFRKHRDLCKEAYAYVKRCPPSKQRCYLLISFKWMKIIRVYMKKKKTKIKSFARDIQASAIQECARYVRLHGVMLDVNSVQEAIEEIEEIG